MGKGVVADWGLMRSVEFEWGRSDRLGSGGEGIDAHRHKKPGSEKVGV